MPTTVVETKIIEDAVRTACRAPSLHNSQPWQWVFNHGQLRLFLDQSRVMDSDHSAREALISCGAALDHLNVAMAAVGWQSQIDRFPNPASPNHLASIEFSPKDFVTGRDRLRANAICIRRTDRLPFSAPTAWDAFESAMAASVERRAVHLDVVADDLHPQLVEAAEIAESLRLYDTPYHDELRWWTAPLEQSQGIPYSALISAAESDRVAVGRVFPISRRPERRLEIPEDHAEVLLLSTDGDSRADALACGEALSETLLECTMVGLATCPVTHLTEVSVTRELIKQLMVRDAMPQVLVRVGVVPVLDPVSPLTPRRPLSDVLRLKG
jgi:nitroreductase